MPSALVVASPSSGTRAERDALFFPIHHTHRNMLLPINDSNNRSMGGKGPEVLSTLTTERGKLLEGLHRTKKKISGSSHLATGIQIASVSLLPLYPTLHSCLEFPFDFC